MRVLVTFAVEAEFAPWRRRHSFVRQRIDAPRICKSALSYQADLDGVTVDVLLTGMGWEYSAGRDALRALFRGDPDYCISTGLAGGLKPEWKCGDIVAAREIGFYQHEEKIISNRYALQVARNCGAEIPNKLITCSHVVL